MKKLLMPLCVTLAWVCLFVSAACAEEELAPGFSSCADKATSTADLVECYTAAHNYWDKILNANFKKAQASCADAATDEKQCRAALLKAQRLWIQYKEAMINAIYAMGSGGTIDNLTTGNFLAKETKKQALLLNSTE